jgi:hypothetical protein
LLIPSTKVEVAPGTSMVTNCCAAADEKTRVAALSTNRKMRKVPLFVGGKSIGFSS